MTRRTSILALVFALLSSVATGGSGTLAQSTQPSPPHVAPDESILSEYTPQAPPSPNPPPYTLLRFNEDHSYLANPRNRTDFFDPVKYIPLDPSNPSGYLTLGGEVRLRYEHFTN